MIIILIMLVVLVFTTVIKNILVIPQASAAIVERFGRYTRILGPGLNFVVPFIDSVKHRIDLREQVVALPPQSVTTRDRMAVKIDTIIHYQVVDPRAAVYEVNDYITAIEELTHTRLRHLIGDIDLARTPALRAEINAALLGFLDEAARKWGIRVNRIELNSIKRAGEETAPTAPPRPPQRDVRKEAKSGRVIGGRYRLISRLGSGGFGQVWKARDESLHVDVAVKEVRLPSSASDTQQVDLLARAVREARNAAQLRDHPSIVTVHDIVSESGAPWMIMQLVDGYSLQEQLDAQGALTVGRTTEIAVALLRALDAAHTADIVHRDIKPANVMLTSNGDVMLTDFGIAVHSTDTRLTATGLFVGSPGYVAPERVRGGDDGGAGDLFSLGVTLYQAVEGRLPFWPDNPTAVVFDEAPRPERAGRLTKLIEQLLEKDPSKRPTAAQALALIERLSRN
ncbi:protein kinase domain-containing protein [Streptomyces olivochromogenes]|uniref:protein kinase domain-containing protein n=1 Tax=Streptomyces olivochromogenes TaxID=1963 RepID=UPI001F3DFBBD|nr:SPFH domain-containing protein [Streptomyces olivochromogenes]MCF3134438.1 protein kinase [Streptomyces olivochromogenes]